MCPYKHKIQLFLKCVNGNPPSNTTLHIKATFRSFKYNITVYASYRQLQMGLSLILLVYCCGTIKRIHLNHHNGPRAQLLDSPTNVLQVSIIHMAVTSSNLCC